MKYRKGIAAIIFRKTPNGSKFLIFHRTKNWEGWEFLKGGVQDGEDSLKSLKREIKEETGIKTYKIIENTGKVTKFKWPKHFVKDHRVYDGAELEFFLVKTNIAKVKIDKREHDDYKWVTVEEALKLLTYNNHKEVLKTVLKKGELK
ncbi:MAG: NUDIX domain-containing protein [Nanoarchaeota archaeon]|nr:NUDIX domain-containing protein [Nanoarchaeota archaeon]